MKLRYWGASPRADQAAIERILAAAAESDVAVEVEYVDVLTSVGLAIQCNVVMTPTLERLEPHPVQRLTSVSRDQAVNLRRLLP